MPTKATVCKQYTFDAAHQLPGHKGKCANLHGHTYKLEVYIRGEIQHKSGTSDDGFVMDFGDIDAVVRPMIERNLDHKFLNDTLIGPGGVRRTTAELIAQWIYDTLAEAGLPMYMIRLWETPNAFAEVS